MRRCLVQGPGPQLGQPGVEQCCRVAQGTTGALSGGLLEPEPIGQYHTCNSWCEHHTKLFYASSSCRCRGASLSVSFGADERVELVCVNLSVVDLEANDFERWGQPGWDE